MNYQDRREVEEIVKENKFSLVDLICVYVVQGLILFYLLWIPFTRAIIKQAILEFLK